VIPLPAPLRVFLAGSSTTASAASAALRLVYLGVFAAQVVVAAAFGLLIMAFLPARPSPHDFVAIVLVAMAAFHVPLAYLLATAASRAGGREAALSATILAGVLASVPAWFAALLLISGQRPLFLLLAMTALALGYALGFLATGRAADAATRLSPSQEPTR
jgi:hypothetical protein